MSSVLMSTRPEWCQKICNRIGEKNGVPIYEKRIEVRKSRPKLEMPFKVYIYCTKEKSIYDMLLISNEKGFEKSVSFGDYRNHGFGWEIGNCKVIGEFVCDRIDCFFARYDDHGSADLEPSHLIYGLGNANQENEYLDKCCLTHDEIFNYIISSQGGYGYGWHISDLKIYDKPKALFEFCKPCEPHPECDCNYCKTHGRSKKFFVKPPQSWCYVEEGQNG